MRSTIKKIGYLSVICSICINANALQALDEHHLSEVSGQDGVTITVDTNISMNRFIWIDKDGAQPVNGNNFSITNPGQGLVVFGDASKPIKIDGGLTRIKIDADGNGSNGNQKPVLNIAIELPDNLTIETGDIYVATRAAPHQPLMNQTKIMNNMSIYLGGLDMNIQLGNSPQGNLAKIYGTVNNGIRVSNVGLLKADGSNIMGMSEFALTDSGGSDFTFNGVGVDIDATGLYISPSLGKIIDVSMNELKFGGNTSQTMGNVFMSGFVLGGNNIRIAGH